MTYNGWRETANGNWVWIEDGVRATVFLNKDDEWGAIWNGADDGQARLVVSLFFSVICFWRNCLSP